MFYIPRIDTRILFQSDDIVSPVKWVAGTFNVGNNQQVVAATASRRVKVVGLDFQGTAAGLPVFRLKSNNAGTVIYNDREVPGIAAGQGFTLPMSLLGYCETSTGHALYIDVVTANLSLNLGYIIYKP